MANSPQYRRLPNATHAPVREKSASERGYNHYWSTVIAPAVRERDEWLCQECLKVGGLGLAMEEMLSRPRNKDGSTREPPVDHIIPAHAIPRSQFYDMDNLQTLCVRHNAEKAVEDAKKYGVAPR